MFNFLRQPVLIAVVYLFAVFLVLLFHNSTGNCKPNNPFYGAILTFAATGYEYFGIILMRSFPICSVTFSL